MDTKTEKRNKIICPTCKGNGFYRVDYALTREETHAQCEDCDRQGEIYLDVPNVKVLRTKGVI
jgi:DnaJ-class molecular chaperone